MWCIYYDFLGSVHDLRMAVHAALALNVPPQKIYAFVCRDDLSPEDFEGRQHEATAAALDGVTQKIAKQMRPGDATWFIPRRITPPVRGCCNPCSTGIDG